MTRTSATLALATLAATTLAATTLAAAPAHAQTLGGFQANDTVTISGAGTHGIYQGSAIDNATTSYSGTGLLSGAVGMDQGIFTLAAGGSLSGGPMSEADGLDLGSNLPGQIGGGTAFITGGTINGFDGINVAGGTVTITGGSITGGAGLGAGLVVTFSSAMPGTGGTINIVGTDFLVNGQAAPNQITGQGTVTNPLTLAGTVSGTLADGELLNTTFQVFGPSTTINFLAPAPAPEPSQFAALAVGLLGLSTLAMRAKRRTA